MNIDIKQLNGSSDAAKLVMYTSNCKSKVIAVLLALLFPGLGHLYANSLDRGIKFFMVAFGPLWLTIVVSKLGLDTQAASLVFIPVSLAAVCAVIWAWFDAAKCIKQWNEAVHVAIFGEKQGDLL